MHGEPNSLLDLGSSFTFRFPVGCFMKPFWVFERGPSKRMLQACCRRLHDRHAANSNADPFTSLMLELHAGNRLPKRQLLKNEAFKAVVGSSLSKVQLPKLMNRSLPKLDAKA